MNEILHAYGGWHKDDAVRADSSSGGAFTLFADAILEQGGIVYGCTLNGELQAVHIGIEKKEDLPRLRGSKYIQSETGGCYGEIRQQLKNGRKVLFCGTPCQAAGLCAFLGDDLRENLFLIDFCCHGVPSPSVFHDYIRWLEDKYADKVTGFRFRSKDHGWRPEGDFLNGVQLGTQIRFEKRQPLRLFPARKDPFMVGFEQDLYLRPSCHACRFKGFPRTWADVSIADFWRVNQIYPQLNDGKGTSLILIHSEKGNALFEQEKDRFFYEEVDPEEALRRNGAFRASMKRPARAKRFLNDYSSKPFSKVLFYHLSPISRDLRRIAGKILHFLGL